jgi:hypothetical protein
MAKKAMHSFYKNKKKDANKGSGGVGGPRRRNLSSNLEDKLTFISGKWKCACKSLKVISECLASSPASATAAAIVPAAAASAAPSAWS